MKIKMKKPGRFQIDMFFLVLSNTLWPLGYSMYIGYFPLYVEELGGTKLTISILASIPFFVGLLAVLGGYLADRMDRKALLLFSWAITVPPPLIWAFANNWSWLLIGQFLYSLSTISSSSLTLYVFDYKSPEDKMLPYSLLNAGGIAGSILAPSIGAAILAAYNIKVLFLTVFVVYTLSTICLLFITKQVPDKIPAKAENDSIKMIFKDLKEGKLLGGMILLALFVFPMNISEPYLSVYLSERVSMSVQMIGTAFTCLFIGATLLTWLFGKSTTKYKPSLLILIGSVIFLTGMTAVISTDNSIAIYAGFFARGVNHALSIYVQGVFVSQLETRNKGLILSIFVSLRNIFVGVAAYPGAFFYGIHPVAPFVSEGVLLVIWLILFYTYMSYSKRKNIKFI